MKDDLIARLRDDNEVLRRRLNPGLNYDWICDDHGKFGCVPCMNEAQWNEQRRVSKP